MNRGISLISPERRRACLLLHGLAASPWEMSDLARTLDLHGWNVSAPLLLDFHDFEKNGFLTLSPDDWITPAQKALDDLISGHDRVVLIGSSLGAVLAGILAAKNPSVAALVMANPPFVYRNPLLRLIIRWPLPLKGFRLHPPPGHEDEYFPYFPFQALKILRKMASEALGQAPEIRQPVLLFSSRKDRSVHPAGARSFMASVGSEKKILRILETAPHSVFAPFHKENTLVFAETLSFLSTHL